MPVLMYDSKTMIWMEKERSRIKAVQMDNLRVLLGIRRMDSPKCMIKGVLLSDERGWSMMVKPCREHGE